VPGQLAFVNHLHLAGELEIKGPVRRAIIIHFNYLTSRLFYMQEVNFLLSLSGSVNSQDEADLDIPRQLLRFPI
jgi:hypothetical protein